MHLKFTFLVLIIAFCILDESFSARARKPVKTTKTTKKPARTTGRTTVGNGGGRRPRTQDELDKGLKKLHDKTRTRIPRTKQNRTKFQSNMRQTSDDAFFINQIASFAFESMDSTSSLSVNSNYCPYTSVTCNSDYVYRSYNGSCNNLANPLYGAANTPYKRLLPVGYDDGINSARTKSVSGNSLPHPRTISLKISPPPSKAILEKSVSHLYPIFGQFLIHDLSGTSATTNTSGIELDCPCGSTDTSCLSLTWPANDPILTGQTCMKLTRSSATFPDFTCDVSYREQLNLLSSYIDGSGIYGIDETRAKELRSFKEGLLTTSEPVNKKNVQVMSGTYLPLSNDTCSTSSTLNYKCFLAGEFRASENLGLVSMHTLFNREHNRIAQIMAANNPTWDDEKLYQETRRIVISILQHIVYNEWLPMVSGDSSLSPDLSTTEYYNGYDSNINPALYNEFSTAAFRFGHSLIRDKFTRYGPTDSKLSHVNFTDVVFKSDYAYEAKSQGIQSFFKGLIKDLCWKFGSFSFELQNKLFGKTENNVFTATDLLATNILRGRDHGLQPYIKYVKECHGIDVKSFNDLKTLMTSTSIANLQAVYENVADIDLYAGGLLEKKISSTTLTAKTFGCIVMKQFADLKNGDRFYYENGPSVNPGAFSLDQLAEIKKVTMSGLICNNYEISSIPTKAFFKESTSNVNLACSDLKNQIDLTKWIS